MNKSNDKTFEKSTKKSIFIPKNLYIHTSRTQKCNHYCEFL